MALPPAGGSICETEAGAADPASFHPGFHWMVLRRHGKRPLAIQGRALLQANNRCAGLPWWSEITIHETAGFHFAACISHTPDPPDGPAWSDAWLCGSAEAVRTLCQGHDPLWALPASPNDPQTIQRFNGAWAGLLAAVFGLPKRPPA